MNRKVLLIAAGVVATGLLLYFFRRPIGRYWANLRLPKVPELQPTTSPKIAAGGSIEVREVGDLLYSNVPYRHLDHGGMKFMVVEYPDKNLALRVGGHTHPDMIDLEANEKVVGAGWIWIKPAERKLVLSGQSDSYFTRLDGVAPVWDKRLSKNIAAQSGLNRVKEFLTQLFGDEICEMTIAS